MILAVPYDSGHEGLRMGAGPLHIRPDAEVVHASEPRAEIATAFELSRLVASRVRAAADLPVVLSGNCGICTGVVGGVGPERLAVLWLDAHGDWMTPETTRSGFLDGMALSVIAGRCWKTLASTIPGFAPVDATRIAHVGGRDFDPGERSSLVDAGAAVVDPSLRALDAAIDQLAAHADRVVVHVDLDVIDPSFGRANHFAAPGGLSPADVLRVIEAASRRLPIAALVLASYDPSGDERGTIAAAAREIVAATLRASR